MRSTRFDPFPLKFKGPGSPKNSQVSDADKTRGEGLPGSFKGAGAGRKNKSKITLAKFSFDSKEDEQ